jgi:hypothetical protein
MGLCHSQNVSSPLLVSTRWAKDGTVCDRVLFKKDRMAELPSGQEEEKGEYGVY